MPPKKTAKKVTNKLYPAPSTTSSGSESESRKSKKPKPEHTSSPVVPPQSNLMAKMDMLFESVNRLNTAVTILSEKFVRLEAAGKLTQKVIYKNKDLVSIVGGKTIESYIKYYFYLFIFLSFHIFILESFYFLEKCAFFYTPRSI
jgi:hypothetical protein